MTSGSTPGSDLPPSFRKTDVAALTGRNLATLSDQLSGVMQARVAGGAPVTIRDLRAPTGAGSSNETFMFDAVWHEAGAPVVRGLVLRIAPSDFRLFRDPRMQDQFALMRALARRGQVRVPQALFIDDSGIPFGHAFFVMERLRGRVPVSFPPYNASGFLVDASVDERRRLWEGAIDQLANIALTPFDDVAFLAEASDDGDFDTVVDAWHDLADWARVSHLPAIALMKEHLEARRPRNPPPGLSWGDARMGNMMFGEDFAVTGVLDWEMMSLGGVLLDLGWWLYFDRLHAEGLGLTRLEGLGTREETLARWESRTRISVAGIEWYELLAGYKLAVINARNAALKGYCEPGNNGNNNIITQQNARMLGTVPPIDVLVPLQVG